MVNKNEKISIPKHVGVIMDGNRRWAKERNLPSFDGHAKGYDKLKMMPAWFFREGVEVLSVFAFSTENWSRKREEVNYLMKLMKKAFEDDLEELNEKGYKLLISGRINELPGDLPEICLSAIEKTQNNSKGILNICLNYGGHSEIVDAVRKIIANNLKADQVHEGMIKKYLYQNNLSDIDLIIRTSGEQRLSGFQLWLGSYSELLFMKKYWPDFEQADVKLIIEEYNQRKRRFGGDI